MASARPYRRLSLVGFYFLFIDIGGTYWYTDIVLVWLIAEIGIGLVETLKPWIKCKNNQDNGVIHYELWVYIKEKRW